MRFALATASMFSVYWPLSAIQALQQVGRRCIFLISPETGLVDRAHRDIDALAGTPWRNGLVVHATVMCSARFPVFNMQYATGVLPET